MLLFVFSHQTVFSSVCCSIFQEKTSRNFEYLKLNKAMKLWVLRSDLSLSKKVCINKRQEPKPTQQLFKSIMAYGMGPLINMQKSVFLPLWDNYE